MTTSTDSAAQSVSDGRSAAASARDDLLTYARYEDGPALEVLLDGYAQDEGEDWLRGFEGAIHADVEIQAVLAKCGEPSWWSPDPA